MIILFRYAQDTAERNDYLTPKNTQLSAWGTDDYHNPLELQKNIDNIIRK